MGHTFAQILFHITFSTKNRRPGLLKLREPMIAYMHGIARNLSFSILNANMVDDHAHLLVRTRTRHTPFKIIEALKSNSSGWVHKTYPKEKDFAWQSGYGIFSVSASGVDDLNRYIDNQERHHQKMTFAEELRELLIRHCIEFDPEHYLD